MSFDASWYTQHPQDAQQIDMTVLEGLSLDQLTSLVSKAALDNNQDRRAEAIRKADSYSFQTANPQLIRSAENTKAINYWLESHGISQPTYPDFQAAYHDLTSRGLLAIDKSKKTPATFKGPLTGKTYESLDDMIHGEREFAIRQVPEQTTIEKAFFSLSPEEQRALLKEGEKAEQLKGKRADIQADADAWLTLHPEYRDDTRSGKLMDMQLRTNGVAPGEETIQDYELAHRQLVAGGMLTQNKAALEKQQAEAIKQRAAKAVNKPGSIFDQTTEEEMEGLSLDELRRRADEELAHR